MDPDSDPGGPNHMDPMDTDPDSDLDPQHWPGDDVWHDNMPFINPRPPWRKSKLHERPSALRREHQALENKNFLHFFLFLWAIFALLDQNQSGSGSKAEVSSLHLLVWIYVFRCQKKVAESREENRWSCLKCNKRDILECDTALRYNVRVSYHILFSV